MILTCPQCDMRYLVSAVSIGPEGRKVRCASCSHVWFQPPEVMESEETFRDILKQEMHSAPIPDSVKPIPEGSNVPAHPKDVPPAKKSTPLDRRALMASVMGYAAAACVMVLIIGAVVLMKDGLVKAWPPSVLFYETIGMDVHVAGEGLAIDRLSATIQRGENADTLTVRGSVINLTSSDVVVPRLLATLKKKDGSQSEQWLIELPTDRVKAESTVEFSTEYPGLPSEAHSVALSFSEDSHHRKDAAAPESDTPVPSAH